MDREPEELQFLGLYGIYKEAYKVILSSKKIFSQITLVLAIPLSFIFLAHLYISDILFSKIIRGEEALEYTRVHSRLYNRINSQISSEVAALWLFKAVYFVFFLILSLLSTAAIVYTIACLYTAKEVTFKRVMNIVPKVWKRLIITFLWNFLIMFGYNFAAIAVLVMFAAFLGKQAFVFVLVFMIILYLIGFVYINVVWQLASVVSVLEDMYGIQAMKKSKALIKGKMMVAIAIYLKLLLSVLGVQVVFQKVVFSTRGGSLGILNKLSYGVVLMSVLALLILYAFVIQTVIYFVCKSYHHESIDKSCLSDHLECYRGDYVPLKSNDLQLEQYYA
ncbi:hypothetical protein Syun_003424 [Stephania yunnanensis]|uniref:Uncharacterized protein n=1 Tax=Stephania yunnanensis TaxID=152371 RepID=A0AAP0L132_9MAGN